MVEDLFVGGKRYDADLPLGDEHAELIEDVFGVGLLSVVGLFGLLMVQRGRGLALVRILFA